MASLLMLVVVLLTTSTTAFIGSTIAYKLDSSKKIASRKLPDLFLLIIDPQDHVQDRGAYLVRITDTVSRSIFPLQSSSEAVGTTTVNEMNAPATTLVSEPDPLKIGRRVKEIGWGRSVPSGMYEICNY